MSHPNHKVPHDQQRLSRDVLAKQANAKNVPPGGAEQAKPVASVQRKELT